MEGLIMMIPIVNTTRDISSRGGQLKKRLAAPRGTVVLEQTLAVPQDAKVLQLILPLMADDDSYEKTRGSIAVTYPVASR
jgi:hypothetical protein